MFFHFGAMGSPKFPLLTPHNYASWKIKAWSKLMEKGLIHYVNETIIAPPDPKVDPNAQIEWLTKNAMALGTLRKYVSDDLIFHIDKCTTIKEAWDFFKKLYGQVDEIKGYKLDSELTTLDLKDFDTIQDYVTKATELRAKLKDCGIDKKDTQLVYNLLDKLPSEYVAFVSSFHTHRSAQGSSYTSPSFDSFTEMLILEQSKLTMMGILKSSKSQALVANKGNQSNQGKGKNQKQPKSKPQQDGAQSSSP